MGPGQPFLLFCRLFVEPGEQPGASYPVGIRSEQIVINNDALVQLLRFNFEKRRLVCMIPGDGGLLQRGIERAEIQRAGCTLTPKRSRADGSSMAACRLRLIMLILFT